MRIPRRIISRLFPLLFVTVALGQDALTSFQEPDRVVVTGSLIPTAEEVTATPLDTLGQREIERSGSMQILEILQKREADMTGAGNIGSTNANIASGQTQGGSTVQIRGLPTLVLYEGRRIADSAAFSTGGLKFADVGIFPASLVSRIEVLKDGASALYGSDAVGGVINIFLKHDYKGAEIGYRYGFTPTSGTQNTTVYVLAGTGNDKTNIAVGYQYYQSSGLFERERAYSTPSFGSMMFAGVASVRDRTTGIRQFYLLNPGLNSPFDVPGVTPGSQTALNTGELANAYSPHSGDFILHSFNLSNIPTSVLTESNQSFFGDFTHEVFGKGLVLFGDILYANNHNESVLNAQPINTQANPGVVIPPGHVSTGPGDPTIYNPFDFTLGAPFTSSIAVPNRYDFKTRTFTNDIYFVRLLGGLRSQITKDYSFETAYYYSNYRIGYVNANLIKQDQLNAMIAGTARDRDGNLIPSLDYFSLNPVGTGPGQVSGAQFATIFGSNIRDQVSTQKVIDAKLTGFPFKLPAGLFGFAFGGEYRTESYSVKDSPEIFVQSVPIQEISISQSVTAVFLELSIPLVSPEMKLPGIYSMDLTLAGRHEHYSANSENSNVPKVTFRYQPVQDLTLRASFANSFVAPNLYQLFGPNSIGFSDPLTLPTSPTGPDFTGQANVLTGSSTKLTPSTAQSYGFGAVYSPKWARGLTLSADYFNVLQQNVVGSIGSATILGSVNRFGPASPYYGLVHVGGFQGPLIPANAGPLGNGTYFVASNIDNLYVFDNNTNVGAARVTGWDFSISYTWDLKRFGTLQLGANAVYYVNNNLRILPNTPYINIKGDDFTEGDGANPKYRVNMLAEYRYRNWTLGFTGQCTPEMYNFVPVTSPYFLQSDAQRIVAYFQIDARMAYTFAAAKASVAQKTVVDPKGGPVRATVSPASRWYDGLTLAIGCNNLFNHQPPFVIGANSNTDLSAYDPFGRLVYFQAAKKF